MAPKNTDDHGENPDKLNFSKTQLTVIIGSIVAIVVLALVLGFLTKKNQATVEEQAKIESTPVEPATELPPADGTKKEELSKLEETLPKQVPQTPADELKQKAEKKAEAASPAPATPPPAAQKEVAPPSIATPAPGAIIEKTAPKPTPKVEEKKPEPAKEKKARHEKPKKKKVHEPKHKALAPHKKQVDVKKINVAPKVAKHKEQKETAAAPVNDAKPSQPARSQQPAQVRVSSFTTEITPSTVPPAPATVEVPAKAAPSPAAPKVEEAKIAEPKAAEPKFTLFTETVASEADAKSRVAALKQSGYQAYYQKKVSTKNTWYHIMSGTYATREEADAAADEFGRKEHATVKVLPYEKP